MLDLANTVDLENTGIANVSTLRKEKGKPKQILFHYLIWKLRL